MPQNRVVGGVLDRTSSSPRCGPVSTRIGVNQALRSSHPNYAAGDVANAYHTVRAYLRSITVRTRCTRPAAAAVDARPTSSYTGAVLLHRPPTSAGYPATRTRRLDQLSTARRHGVSSSLLAAAGELWPHELPSGSDRRPISSSARKAVDPHGSPTRTSHSRRLCPLEARPKRVPFALARRGPGREREGAPPGSRVPRLGTSGADLLQPTHAARRAPARTVWAHADAHPDPASLTAGGAPHRVERCTRLGGSPSSRLIPPPPRHTAGVERRDHGRLLVKYRRGLSTSIWWICASVTPASRTAGSTSSLMNS